MYFCHSPEIWRDFPELVPGVLLARGIRVEDSVAARTTRFREVAAMRLEGSSEGEMPEIQAWRRAFSKMGLKPTQCRCAAESLLRRFRKEKVLPQILPLIDLCNSISLAFAIPIAVFDVSRISDYLQVRYANGSEVYSTLSGELEHPEPGEVIFADSQGKAHARRWTNRQSGYSAVRGETSYVLIAAEAMHSSAQTDIQRLVGVIAGELRAIWSVDLKTAILNKCSPRFEF